MSKLIVTIKRVPRGAYITMGGQTGIAEISKRMDGTTGLAYTGNVATLGHDHADHDAEYEAAIMATLADSQSRTLTYSEDVDTSAELDQYERDHAEIEDAMTLGGHTY